MTKEELNEIIALISTHVEHEGGYCDTGEDMEWSCRSECTRMAVERVLEKYKELLK